jgi:hypothetical protein
MIDWRKLFIAYGQHVGEAEGIDFLGYDPELSSWADGFSSEEHAAILAARKEIRQEPFHSLSRNEDADAVRPAPQFLRPAFPYENKD